MIPRRGGWLPGAAAALLGAVLLGQQAWLAAKAELAGLLIERAWRARVLDGGDHRPWPWADTRPLARLRVPRLGVERIVLAGASGSSLAFGPGHVDGTAPPNGPGTSVIAGHRDGNFAFLERLRDGDAITLDAGRGPRRYRVRSVAVHSMWDGAAVPDDGTRRLVLVTCWPFDGWTASDLRYVVVCEPDRPEAPLRAAPPGPDP